ncbi:MAG TPA: hypothetical protein VG870_09720 [Chitinophagaceae bacterium]|nr:hypothetical protein [Chitinophagaceae bacterium]
MAQQDDRKPNRIYESPRFTRQNGRSRLLLSVPVGRRRPVNHLGVPSYHQAATLFTAARSVPPAGSRGPGLLASDFRLMAYGCR